MLKGKYGARFLKEENIESDGLGWIEVSNETARQKVRAAFRDFRTKMNKTTTAPTAATNSSSLSVITEAASSSISSSTKNKIQTILSLSSSQQIQQSDSSTSAFLTMDGSVAKNQQSCFSL